MPAVSPVTANPPAATGDASQRMPIQTLSQNDFLKLLVTQLAAQDPFNPQTNTDFSAQMAQFSALEQTKTMSGNISKLNTQEQFSEAAALLGRTVKVDKGGGNIDEGVVTGLQVDAGTPKVIVNGNAYSVDNVLAVALPVGN